MSAISFLTRKYNQFMRGRPPSTVNIWVSQPLYDDFSNEIEAFQRFTTEIEPAEPNLRFKSGIMRVMDNSPTVGYAVKMTLCPKRVGFISWVGNVLS